MKKIILFVMGIFIILPLAAQQTDAWVQAVDSIKNSRGTVPAELRQKQENAIILAYFSAPWCPPCRKFKKEYLEDFLKIYKARYNGRVEYREFDINNPRDFKIFSATAKAFGKGLGIPAAVVGNTFIGEMNKETLEAAIDKAIKNNERTILAFGTDGKYPDIVDAASAGDYDAVKSFLDNGADINKPGGFYEGFTALAAASFYGHEKIVELLLSYKNINVNQTTSWESTALTEASFTGHANIVRMLLARGADIYMETSYGNAITEAAKGLQSGILKMFKSDYGVDIDHRFSDGKTALMWYVEKRDEVAVAEVLISAGANVNAENNGVTVLMLAKTQEMKNFLISRGAK